MSVPIKHKFRSHPLIYPEKKICLYFSAKAGCTLATKWFFYQQGLLNEALAYNAWVHEYRRFIYNKTATYKNELNQVKSSEYFRIKLVRSPYQRAVSSYIHAVMHNHINTEMTEFLARPLTAEHRFSFEEFISFLEKTGVQDCNPHNRVQALPEEQENKLSFSYIIKIENSHAEFKEIEKKLNLKNSDFESLSESYHHRKKVPSEGYNGDKIMGRINKLFFEYESFYNKSLKDQVAKLYACDFFQYQYKIDEF
ncbi:MAG: hypothetical protein ACI9XC_000410 [Gammaproteobacteria bacterium]|jgi:hypothetical protein